MSLVKGRPLFRPGDISTNLVGWWPLTSDFTDSGPNGFDLAEGNDGTAIDWTTDEYWVSQKCGSFLEAHTQYGYIADQAELDITGNMTIVAWCKVESVGGIAYIVSKGNPGTEGYDFGRTATGELRFNANATAVTTTTALSTGRWYHVAVVFKPADDIAIFYIDGNLDKIVTQADTIAGSDLQFCIGRRSAAATDYWDGLLKDVAIWDAALTPLQIKSLALGQDLSKYATRPGTNGVPTPSAWWKMNEAVASGTRADSIGSLDLTDNGTVPAGAGYIEGAAPHLDGSADYFSASDNTAFDFSGGTFSISAWINPDTVAGNDIIYQQSTDADNYFQFRLETGVLNLSIVTATSEVVNVVGATTLPTGRWSHVAVTESGDTWKVYLSGQDDTDSGGDDAQRALNYTGDIRIGTDHAGANDFDGFIADVAIWKGTALTAEQVRKLACGLDLNDQAAVLYCKMNATSGNETDVIGGHTMTDSGATGTEAGQVGTARNFVAATPDYLEVTRTANLDLTDGFTILGWLNPDDDTSVTIIDKDLDTAGYGISLDASKYISFNMNNGVRSTGTTAFTAGSWYSFACRYNQAQTSVFSNGKLEDTDAYATDCSDSATNMHIGVRNDESTAPYDGGIDEFVIFKRPLLDEEITALYIKGLNGKEFWNSDKPTGGFLAVLLAT